MVIETYLITLYSTITHIFVRIFGLFISMPLMSTGIMPLRIRIVLTMLLSIMLLYIVPPVHFDTFLEMVIQSVFSFFTGVVIGLVMQIPFQAFITGGQIMAYQMGLGFAMVVDPVTGVNIPSVSQFFYILMTFTFLFLDVHLSLIRIIVQSFEGNYVTYLFEPGNIKVLTLHFAEVFSFGLQIALTTVIMMLITNIALALMTKAAPSINIFSIGFPLMILTGIAILYLSFFSSSPLAVEILEKTINLIEV